MKVLVTGATGATGRLLVKQLLDQRCKVKAVVRSPEKLQAILEDHSDLEIIKASILDISNEDLKDHIKVCDALVSCLGHNLTLKGMFGKPRRLVRDAVKNLCKAVQENSPDKPIKFILMNTTGNMNKNLQERRSIGEKIVMGLVRFLLPPQIDNEQAAEFLRTDIGTGNKDIEWVVVRPDGLVNEDLVSEYSIHPSPTRSPIFNAGTTSRINVANFMTRLILEEDLWKKWKGEMPVIYNV